MGLKLRTRRRPAESQFACAESQFAYPGAEEEELPDSGFGLKLGTRRRPAESQFACATPEDVSRKLWSWSASPSQKVNEILRIDRFLTQKKTYSQVFGHTFFSLFLTQHGVASFFDLGKFGRFCRKLKS